MNLLKKIMSGLLLMCLFLSLSPAAGADDDFTYEGKSWEQVVDELFRKYDVQEENIGLGYYNLVTGEEHYVNEDQYMVSGSMFKVPLNMLFTEKVGKGELDPEDLIGGYRYSDRHSDGHRCRMGYRSDSLQLVSACTKHCDGYPHDQS